MLLPCKSCSMEWKTVCLYQYLSLLSLLLRSAYGIGLFSVLKALHSQAQKRSGESSGKQLLPVVHCIAINYDPLKLWGIRVLVKYVC